MASGTGLLDRSLGAWSEGFGAQLGIELDRLPEIVDDEEPIGRFSPTASRRWPSFAHIDWFAAWGDGACGNVGLGAEGRDTVALMIGTSGALRAVIPDPDPAIRAGLFAQRLGAGSVVGGQLSEGGGTIAWASRLLGRPSGRSGGSGRGVRARGARADGPPVRLRRA